jgi:hypothetical protein
MHFKHEKKHSRTHKHMYTHFQHVNTCIRTHMPDRIHNQGLDARKAMLVVGIMTLHSFSVSHVRYPFVTLHLCLKTSGYASPYFISVGVCVCVCICFHVNMSHIYGINRSKYHTCTGSNYLIAYDGCTGNGLSIACTNYS